MTIGFYCLVCQEIFFIPLERNTERLVCPFCGAAADMLRRSQQSNWYVITGGISAGKTSLIKVLTALGLFVAPEPATLVIQDKMAKGLTIKEIRADEYSFHQEAIAKRVELESALDKNELIFFDRGWGDVAGFSAFYNFPPSPQEIAGQEIRYKGVFFLEQNEFKLNANRIETPDQNWQILQLIRKNYISLASRLGYEFASVPVMPIYEKALFILAQVIK